MYNLALKQLIVWRKMWLSILTRTGGLALYKKSYRTFGKFTIARESFHVRRVRDGIMGKVAIDLILKVLDKWIETKAVQVGRTVEAR